jgi:archaellum component FlaF (FlaF/FlaG flagellin family)
MRRATLLSMACSLVAAGIGLVGVAPANAANTGVTVAGGNGEGSAANQFDLPWGLVLDNHGNVYVADDLNNRVQRWAPGATSGTTVAGGNGAGSAGDQLDSPLDVAFDGDNLYISDRLNDRVQRWAPGATSGVTVAGGNGKGSAANQLSNPLGVALDRSGNLLIADTVNNRVQRWAPGAASGVTVAGGNGVGSAANQLSDPSDVALDNNGDLYVADRSNNRVQRWSPGALSGVTVAGGNGSGSAAHQFNGPTGLATDDSGILYVGDQFNYRVQRWAPGATSGVTVAGGNGSGSAADQLTIPSFVALDSSSNLYVSDTGNHRVQRWAAGTPTVVPGVASTTERDSGTTTLAVPVTLSVPSTQVVTAQWNTLQVPGNRPDQADPTTDYTPTSGTVTFNPGETDTTVSITINGDSLVEPDEYVIVSFHDPTNATMGGFWGLGIGFIDNDDHAVATPGIASMIEGNTGTTTLALPITLTNPSMQTVTVQWTTVQVPGDRPDQADPTTDYTPTSGTVTFAPGETDTTVTIAITGDTLVEPDEYIIVSFHDPTNAIIGGFWGLGVGVITDND